MERFYVIKVDDGLVYVREATRDYRDGSVNYRHAPDSEAVACNLEGPLVYGSLENLLSAVSEISAKPTLDSIQNILNAHIAKIQDQVTAAENKVGAALDSSIQAESLIVSAEQPGHFTTVQGTDHFSPEAESDMEGDRR